MLNLLFWIGAALATGGAYLFGDGLSPWWIVPILLGTYLSLTVAYFVVILVGWLFLLPRKVPKKPSAFCHGMIYLAMSWLCSVLRIRIRIRGQEKLPPAPCVIVSNHLSDFDPMTMLGALRGRRLVYISKESNFKIPVVGEYIRHAGFLPIDRENPRRALRTLGEAGDKMRSFGVDVGIYPEGTRSRTGKLGRFKEGGFVLAKRAEAPIVVLLTKGTENVKKNFPFRPTRVTLEVLCVMEKETVCQTSVEELCARAREIIEDGLAR